MIKTEQFTWITANVIEDENGNRYSVVPLPTPEEIASLKARAGYLAQTSGADPYPENC